MKEVRRPIPRETRRPVFSIGVTASLTGLPPSTIRRWMRAGFVSPVRAANGWRMFSWQDIEVLRRVRDLSRRGLPAAEIRRRLRRRWVARAALVESGGEAAVLPALRRLTRGLERGRRVMLAIPTAVRPA